MSYPKGDLPTHYRADQNSVKAAVRARYQKAREVAGTQVAVLQKEPAFLQEAAAWYVKGYKDWHLVSGIVNALANRTLARLGLNVFTGRPPRVSQDDLMRDTRGTTAPLDSFLGTNFEHMLTTFELAVLRTYGFELRTSRIDPARVHRFLRDRMRFFDFDFSHRPLFGDPPGDWPQI